MSSINAARRGMTMVELLVASAVTLMFLGMLYGMFLPVIGIASASSAKTDTLTAATTAMYQLEADVRVSTTRGITVGSTPAALASTLGSGAETQVLAVEAPENFANVNDNHGQYQYDPASGLPDFQSYVVWSLVPATAGACSSTNPCTLYRTTTPAFTPTTAATAIPSSTLSTATASIATAGRVMAKNITSFQLANVTVACSTCAVPIGRPEVRIEMAAQSTDQSGNISQTSYETQVFDRNN